MNIAQKDNKLFRAIERDPSMKDKCSYPHKKIPQALPYLFEDDLN